MFKLSLFVLLCVISVKSNAYYLTSFNSEKLDYKRPTRLLIAGAGDDLGTQFLDVARGSALKYYQLDPNEQIILISAKEPNIENIATLKKLGFNFQFEDRSTFNGDTFLEEAVKFEKIASIDIFSHSSAQYGIHLDGKAHRLTLNTKKLENLKGKFIKNAYTFLHGCNAGFNLAPFLSNLWEIPVAGAMTSSNFQKLHSDGNFYLTEENMFPNSDWAKVNSKSFNDIEACKNGACIRLKPDNSTYIGFWGEYYEGGLPFYKFFCLKNTDLDCRTVMAKSMLSFVGNVNLKPTSNLADYKKLVLDFLCPVSSKRDLRGECEENLENALISGDLTYNPYLRPQIECDFKRCEVEIKCKKIFLTGIYKPGSCILENNFSEKSTTLVREYKAYLEGFKNLNN
jgi:hypothetical protein